MDKTNINLDPNTAQGIEIKLSDGRVYSIRDKATLDEIDEEQEAIFLFNNGEIYCGRSDGQVDEDGEFVLLKKGKKLGIALPFSRLAGWAYELPPRDPVEVIREQVKELAEQAAKNFGIDLLSVRLSRNDDGQITDIALSYEEQDNSETEGGV